MPTTHPATAETPVAVLVVISKAPDQRALSRLFDHSNWVLHEAEDARSAIQILQTKSIPIVLFDCESAGGCWRELLRNLNSLPKPPLLIIASDAANANLWADALSLGVYDVLAKPFDQREVFQVLTMAWRRWAYGGAKATAP
jgi:CheY-like chemotaxis protein